MTYTNQDFLPRLRAKKEKKEVIEAIVGGALLVGCSAIIIILISLMA